MYCYYFHQSCMSLVLILSNFQLFSKDNNLSIMMIEWESKLSNCPSQAIIAATATSGPLQKRASHSWYRKSTTNPVTCISISWSNITPSSASANEANLVVQRCLWATVIVSHPLIVQKPKSKSFSWQLDKSSSLFWADLDSAQNSPRHLQQEYITQFKNSS